jgi:hypothetical protein
MDEGSMDQKPDRRKIRSYTLAALLGLFVLAALTALASRILPGPMSRLARRVLRGAGGQDRGES